MLVQKGQPVFHSSDHPGCACPSLHVPQLHYESGSLCLGHYQQPLGLHHPDHLTLHIIFCFHVFKHSASHMISLSSIRSTKSLSSSATSVAPYSNRLFDSVSQTANMCNFSTRQRTRDGTQPHSMAFLVQDTV
jgi:hypothetical protein